MTILCAGSGYKGCVGQTFCGSWSWNWPLDTKHSASIANKREKKWSSPRQSYHQMFQDISQWTRCFWGGCLAGGEPQIERQETSFFWPASRPLEHTNRISHAFEPSDLSMKPSTLQHQCNEESNSCLLIHLACSLTRSKLLKRSRGLYLLQFRIPTPRLLVTRPLSIGRMIHSAFSYQPQVYRHLSWILISIPFNSWKYLRRLHTLFNSPPLSLFTRPISRKLLRLEARPSSLVNPTRQSHLSVSIL